MKTKFIPALAILLLASSGAWAHDDWAHQNNGWSGGNSWNNGWNNQTQQKQHRNDYYGNSRHGRHDSTSRHSGLTTYIYQSTGSPIVIYETPRVVYENPRVVYETPQVVYRDRVIYRDVPVQQGQVYGYPQNSAPRQYQNGSPIVGTAIGAIAGGALGSQFGKGNGRTASTAIGAVIGGALGGEYLGR
ncbi:MAG: glycine zipper 2TM domain-containing protein [Rhodocyclaceae bacterium]|nr:glycine zipper 2TM domain-containing protein [Rhodocyclaceae bacterium]